MMTAIPVMGLSAAELSSPAFLNAAWRNRRALGVSCTPDGVALVWRRVKPAAAQLLDAGPFAEGKSRGTANQCSPSDFALPAKPWARSAGRAGCRTADDVAKAQELISAAVVALDGHVRLLPWLRDRKVRRR